MIGGGGALTAVLTHVGEHEIARNPSGQKEGGCGVGGGGRKSRGTRTCGPEGPGRAGTRGMMDSRPRGEKGWGAGSHTWCRTVGRNRGVPPGKQKSPSGAEAPPYRIIVDIKGNVQPYIITMCLTNDKS